MFVKLVPVVSVERCLATAETIVCRCSFISGFLERFLFITSKGLRTVCIVIGGILIKTVRDYAEMKISY